MRVRYDGDGHDCRRRDDITERGGVGSSSNGHKSIAGTGVLQAQNSAHRPEWKCIDVLRLRRIEQLQLRDLLPLVLRSVEDRTLTLQCS